MKRTIQWLRYGLRFGVLALLFVAPWFAHQRVVATGGHAQGHTTPSPLKGNVWSAQVAGVSITDPLGGVEGVAASRGASVATWIGMAIPVVVTVLLGRVFCSWICPAGLLFELADKLRRPDNDAELRPLWRGHKYTLLGAGLALSFLVGLPLLSLFYPPAVLGREASRMTLGFLPEVATGATRGGALVLTGGAVFLVGIAVIELFGWRRAWCAKLCPGGALYSLLGARRLLWLRNDTSVCTRCRDCIPACPMGLNPMQNQFGPECDNCLVCRTACAPGSIRFGSIVSRRATSHPEPKETA